MHTSQMIETSPFPAVVPRGTLTRCIEACFDCAQACAVCADACIAEDNVAMLRRTIRLCDDCADICLTSGRVVSRQFEAQIELMWHQLAACMVACTVTGDECARHAARYDHCRVCADICHDCANACLVLFDALGLAPPRATA